MNIFQAIILGIIQGLTEFLPISSSAHLVILPFLLGWEIPQTEAFVFNVLVQTASLIALILYFWQDLGMMIHAALLGLIQRNPFQNKQAQIAWLLILATLPAGFIGLGIKPVVEQAFTSPLIVAFFLLITALLLFTAEWLGTRTKKLESMNWKDAVFIGFAQALAIFPGISRSGATIAGGMFRGFERSIAARFSFYLVIPIMIAAGLSAGSDLIQIQNWENMLKIIIPGMLASAIVSYISIRWLLRFLIHHSLKIFAVYCAILSLAILTLSWIG